MVTNKGASANLECKSTDVKPTTDVDVNTKIHELDTDKWYYFTGDTWAEIPSSGGGGGFTPTQTQLDAMNSGITEQRVTQLGGIDDTGDDYIEINGIRLYISSTAPTGDIPDGSVGVGW